MYTITIYFIRILKACVVEKIKKQLKISKLKKTPVV
jgi:hypothetical protein